MRYHQTKRKKRILHYKSGKNTVDIDKKLNEIKRSKDNQQHLKDNTILYNSGWLKMSEVADSEIDLDNEKVRVVFDEIEWDEVNLESKTFGDEEYHEEQHGY